MILLLVQPFISLTAAESPVLWPVSADVPMPPIILPCYVLLQDGFWLVSLVVRCACLIILQIQLFVHPFHRMFYLSNKAIQYPFAEVERVPVCKGDADLYISRTHVDSMVDYLCRHYSVRDPLHLGRHVSSRFT